MRTPAPHAPVFYDEGGRRWRRVRALAALVTLALLGLAGALLTGVLRAPALPAPPLPAPLTGHARPVPHPRANRAPLLDREPGTLGAAATGARPRLQGFYVNWDDNSMTSLRRNLASLDTLTPEWLHLADGGNVTVDDPVKGARLLALVHSARPGLPVVPLINNYDQDRQVWASGRLARVLHDPRQRSHLIGRLLAEVRREGFAGVNIDFENVPDRSQGDLVTLMRELHARFAPLGLTVSQDVPLDDPAFSYRALGQAADRLVLMAYDEHEDSSAPGPVASQGWLIHALRGRLRDLDPARVTVALGNYGYDWTDGRPGAQELTFQEALTAAHDSDAAPHLDRGSLNPTYAYSDDAGRTHHVWYLDAASSYDELSAARALGVRDFALWRLGTEDPSTWALFGHALPTGSAATSALRTLHYGYDLDYEGQGELLRVTATPRDGSRDLRLGQGGLIVGETVHTFASPFVIRRWGAQSPKKIALTFDDGPDPLYTGQILDVLKREHVPATFFVIGLNGQGHPELLRRIAAEGHELGNHTFTHPNIALVPRQQFRVELNATERLIEGATGRGTLLFRPPFAEDVEPATPEEAALIAHVSAMGYYTVGMGIDPDDWQRPGADAIVRSVLAQVGAGAGHIVLLHDAGGDRSQTVAALPRLIHELRARGYQLVTVSNLVGLPGRAVMPPVTPGERLLDHLDLLNFLALGGFGRFLALLFTGGIVLSVLRLAFISVLALLDFWRRGPAPLDNALSVSVIVPAYNEARVVNKTLASLLAQDVPGLDILLIDDGSTDGTAEVASKAYGHHPRVHIHTVPNGGKARALNHGLAHATTDLVVLLDADTVLGGGAVRRLRARFTSPEVAAVAGNAKVGNRVNLLTRWQALEYITAQNMERRAFARLNAMSVVPGAIGAWRREVLLSLGGFHHDTLAEDADLTLRVLSRGLRVTYEQGAVAHTEAPETVRAFFKQRFRWMFGTLQATWKRRGALRGGSRNLGLFTLPNVVLFQIVFPPVSALLDLAMVSTLVWTLLQRHYHPADGGGGNGDLARTLAFYGLFLGVDLLAAVLAFVLEGNEDWRLLPLLPLQRFFYRQLMYVVAIRAVLTALRGPQVGWGHLERRASVTFAEQQASD